jgi:hypothetical protein
MALTFHATSHLPHPYLQYSVPCWDSIIDSFFFKDSPISLASDIVMSAPALYRHGAVFIIFPLKQASNVLGDKEAKYIKRTLMEIAVEIPVAQIVAAGIQRP